MKTMKIAVPTSGTLVDEHFGHCTEFTVYEIIDGHIERKVSVKPPEGCGCKSNIVPMLSNMGVRVMLTGGIGAGAVNILNYHGISVVRGANGPADDCVALWLQGTLHDQDISCNHDHGCNHHH